MKKVWLFALVRGRTKAEKRQARYSGTREGQSYLALTGESRDLSTVPEWLPGILVDVFLGHRTLALSSPSIYRLSSVALTSTSVYKCEQYSCSPLKLTQPASTGVSSVHIAPLTQCLQTEWCSQSPHHHSPNVYRCEQCSRSSRACSKAALDLDVMLSFWLLPHIWLMDSQKGSQWLKKQKKRKSTNNVQEQGCAVW